MFLENDIKLDFKDVLIKPKRSNLNSRSDVTLEREFTFKHSSFKWKGVPIMVSNMDCTGTFDMALALQKHKMFTCIHKYYSVEDWKIFKKVLPISVFNGYTGSVDGGSVDGGSVDGGSVDGINVNDIFNYLAVSSGSKEEDFQKLQSILKEIPEINFICLDVANGYTEHFVSFVMRVRLAYPDKVIIAGSVVTREMTEELLIKGADIVKVGIGPGSVCTTRKKTGVG